MLERGKKDREQVEFVVMDQLVPREHLLRKIDAVVDFTQLYKMVEPLYSEDNGCPSIDPVVLFKMVLIQHLYGLPSLRRTAEEVQKLYKKRKETIERVFADAKEKHVMRYTQYRGLAQVTNWVKLTFAVMNLKKLATWKWRDLLPSFRFAIFSLIYVRNPVCS